jgi:hypothetical protein
VDQLEVCDGKLPAEIKLAVSDVVILTDALTQEADEAFIDCDTFGTKVKKLDVKELVAQLLVIGYVEPVLRVVPELPAFNA